MIDLNFSTKTFTLYDEVDNEVMKINAKNEKEAWKKVRKTGIRNQSGLFTLGEVHG